MPSYPDQINVENYESASGAAKRIQKYLKNYAESIGYNPSEVIICKPDDCDRDCWAVIWGEGPENWAKSLKRGDSIGGYEYPENRGNPEIKGLSTNPKVDIQCGKGYILEFYG